MNHTSQILSRIWRGYSITVALRVLRIIVNLVITSFLARELGQGGFGQLMVSMSLVSLLLCFSEMGFNRITVRELVSDEDGAWHTLGATFFTRLAVGTLLYGLLVVYVLALKPEHGSLVLIYGVLLFTHAGTETLAWFEVKGQMERLAWAQLIGFIAGSVATVVGLILKMPLWFYAVCYLLECWFSLSATLWLFHNIGGRMKTWRWSWDRARALLGESWFEIVSQLALLLLFRVDTIMVEALRGAEEAGVYGAAVRVSEVVYFLPGMLSNFFLSPLLQLKKSDLAAYHRGFADYMGMTLMLTAVLAACVAFAAPITIRLLFGKDFTASSSILLINAWALIPYAIGLVRTQYLAAEGRLWVNLPSVLTALVLNIGLNWLWIPRWSGEGAAWATLISYSVAWVLSSFVLPQALDTGRVIIEGFLRIPPLGLSLWRRFQRRTL